MSRMQNRDEALTLGTCGAGVCTLAHFGEDGVHGIRLDAGYENFAEIMVVCP